MQYRFSPINSKIELLAAIEYLHIQSHSMCFYSFSKYLPNAGNVGIFTHSLEEHEYLTQLRKEMTYSTTNPDQKYFTLKQSIIFQENNIPETEYKYLYIRKPKVESPQVGDIDFYLEDDEFESVKKRMLSGENIPGARIFERADLNMIELYNPDSDVLAYVSTLSETQKVRIKQSDATIL